MRILLVTALAVLGGCVEAAYWTQESVGLDASWMYRDCTASVEWTQIAIYEALGEGNEPDSSALPFEGHDLPPGTRLRSVVFGPDAADPDRSRVFLVQGSEPSFEIEVWGSPDDDEARRLIEDFAANATTLTSE